MSQRSAGSCTRCTHANAFPAWIRILHSIRAPNQINENSSDSQTDFFAKILGIGPWVGSTHIWLLGCHKKGQKCIFDIKRFFFFFFKPDQLHALCINLFCKPKYQSLRFYKKILRIGGFEDLNFFLLCSKFLSDQIKF